MNVLSGLFFISARANDWANRLPCSGGNAR